MKSLNPERKQAEAMNVVQLSHFLPVARLRRALRRWPDAALAGYAVTEGARRKAPRCSLRAAVYSVLFFQPITQRAVGSGA